MIRVAALLVGLFASLLSGTAGAEERFITLGSTSTTEESGLFAHLFPIFLQASGIEVRVIAVGTGQALRLARRGDVDVVLTHDRAGEDDLVSSGFGLDRRDAMYNDFIIVGPSADPARLRGGRLALPALRAIGAASAPFASLADDSGNNRTELRLWAAAGIDPKPYAKDWYFEVNAPLGQTLNAAAAMGAYALADRAGWAHFKERRGLVAMVEGDVALFNPYGSVLVNPARYRRVKAADALIWHEWLTSAAGRKAITDFTIDGQQVYFVSGGGRV